MQLTIEQETARAEQLALNCRWLIDKMDRIHAALCPDKCGSWVTRAEQAAKAAEEKAKNKTSPMNHCDYCPDSVTLDSDLLNYLEKVRPNILPIAKPYNGEGEPQLSHWEIEFNLHSVCRPTLREAIMACMQAEKEAENE